MASANLTDPRVRVLEPRKSAYDIRDADLKGFGVRVLPSGGTRFFVHCQYEARRVWKILGDAAEISAGEARSRATAMLAEIRQDGPPPALPEEALFEAVAEATFRTPCGRWRLARA